MMTEAGKDDLTIYLRDHFAGGVGAIELLEHLTETHQQAPLGLFFARLLEEVRQDHSSLHQVMAALEIKESAVRDAGAWVAEKFGRGKLGFGGGATSGVRLLQALETLFLGIQGKLLLWRVLAGVQDPTLAQWDFHVLERRATDQLKQVDTERLEAASATFHRLP